MKSVLKSLFKKKSRRHVDSDNQCDPGAQYGVSNIGNDLEPLAGDDDDDDDDDDDHNSDNGAGVSPNQSNVLAGNASNNGDIKGKGKKRDTSPVDGVKSSTLGSCVQNRIFGNGNPYVVFHSLTHPTPCSTTPVITPEDGSGSGSGSNRYENRPIPSDGVRYQVDDPLVRAEVTMSSISELSKSQASGSAYEAFSGTTTSSTSARLRESQSLQHGKSEFPIHSDHSMSISAAANSQSSSAVNELRPRIRKTLSLEWRPEHKNLATSVPPLRFQSKRSTALIYDSSPHPQRLELDTPPTSASQHSSQRVKGPRPIPNFEELQDRERRSRLLDSSGLSNISAENRGPLSQPETVEQDDVNLALIKSTSTVPRPNHRQHYNVPKGQAHASQQQSSLTIDRSPSVHVELSSHNAGNAGRLLQDVQQFLTETVRQKTHVPYPSAPITSPEPKARLSCHPPMDNSSSANATFGVCAPLQTPSSPVISTATSNKRLSNTTSRCTARRIIYLADLEHGLPQGRIARESNFEIVPSNRISISSLTNSSATNSRYYTRPSQFAEGVDIQDLSTATIVVQSNKRGIGRVRSSEAAQRSNSNVIPAIINPGRDSAAACPESVNYHKRSDSDEELDAAHYKAEVLKRAAEEAASAATIADAKARAAAAEVAEARATKRRLREQKALKVSIQACDPSSNESAASKDSAGN
ncbi:hypothetical protein BGZ68_006553 [Mortierella alpina]|nr:hypothetical protein BGZ68_006553 [Mortierella alpina]